MSYSAIIRGSGSTMDLPSRRGPRGSLYVTRACDSCKRRKVKCDAGRPCASCHASNIHCSYTIVPQKRGRVGRRRAVEPSSSSSSSSSPAATQECNEATVSSVVESSERPTPAASSSHPSLAFTYSTSPRTTISFSAHDPISDAERIRAGFIDHVAAQLMSGTVEDLVDRCIDLFMQFIFPNTPVCHEPTLRAGVALFQLKDSADATQHPILARTFTLVTALCALVLSVAPDSYIPQRATLALEFLRASRAMLLTYVEHDLERPDWTSLIIRVWQSSATQNVTGRNGEAHHYYSEASMLALHLRLYQEESVSWRTPLDAQLLRSNFWQLYLSDKSAAVLDDRCRLITEHVFEEDLTLLERGSPEVPLLDMTRKQCSPLLDSRFQEGHLLKRQIWRSGVSLVTAIGAIDDNSTADHVTGLYLDFTGLIDGFPLWLWNPNQYLDGEPGASVSEYHKMCFWAQRSSIILSFHTLKLVILRACIDHDVPGVMGFDHNELSWHQRKLDISRDFLSELQMVPFDCIKMQGEPTVRRLRNVGTVLLEIVHNTNNESMKTRAQSQLVQLLDVLAKLDSRASDELR
ncbi:hypothetical protein EDB81DRAFT_485640 [Dactylonectria macrodidyma]|uniref:Zn(2)-C6 fungal-type domain-containing protein n=1 Tax=Dactylonectria macrodidyma TaxID=307937 RepID=A0A9P9EWB3_9HYPO|nr:hypothetical protein EDB81DRAFT_485640 [Dactylonectria macrodidyma]